MKKLLAVITGFFILTLVSSVSHAQSQLQKEIRNAFDTIKYIAQQPTTILEFDETDNSETESLQKGKVIVNQRQIQYILNRVDRKYTKDVIRLVIAHEIGHQVQFRFYNNNSFSPVLNECQADILAGFFLFQISLQEFYKEHPGMVENDPRSKDIDPIFARVVLAGVSAIFDLGDDYTKDNTHPRNEQRRLAVRDGFAYGNLWVADIAHNNPQMSEHIHQIAYEEETRLKSTLNFLPGDNVVTWSYRHAKNIVHYQPENSKDIVVYSDWKWNTSSDNPYCNYVQKIKNIGNKVVTVNFEDQIYTALRTDPKNSLYWNIVSTNPYSITLQPGEIRTINDRIKWDATNKMEPYFIKIGDASSLYSCSTLNHGEMDVTSYRRTIGKSMHPPSLETVLDVILSERDKLPTYIEGVGSVQLEDSFNDISYTSRLKVAFAEDTKIHYNPEKDVYSMYIYIYSGTNIGLARNKLNKLFDALKVVAPNYQYEKTNDTDDNQAWRIYGNGHEYVGRIVLQKEDDNSYNAMFRINELQKN